MSDVFTEEDIKSADHYGTLGPAYFAARRVSERLMQGVESEPFKKVTTKVVETLRDELYAYVEDSLRSDLEANLHHHIQNMAERSVQALLTGEEWAMRQYPFAQYCDGEAVRAAVAKHGGEPLLMARIADLEKEVARLTEALQWARR